MPNCAVCQDSPQTARIQVGDGQLEVTGCAAHLYLLAERAVTGRRVAQAIAGYPKEPEFRCPKCGRTSPSPWDAIFGFCPACRTYTG